jgi:cyclophilin family peptidyl-prolyl cis-trans isomerase
MTLAPAAPIEQRLAGMAAAIALPDAAYGAPAAALAALRAALLDRTATARGYAVFGSVTSGASIVTAMTTAACSTWAGVSAETDAPSVKVRDTAEPPAGEQRKPAPLADYVTAGAAVHHHVA